MIVFDLARLPRFELAGVPQHVVQRGNNRLPGFLDDEDRQRYLQCLRQALLRFGCKLHAYVLMSNHVHLLLTPDEAGAVSRLMHTFARNYVGMFNGRHGRTGTLWEGRYKACPVDSECYFLACSRYIELNPVRAWMVAEPGEHPWSSYRANAEGRVESLLTPHPAYLGSVPGRRLAHRRTGPCLRTHCPTGWSVISVVTCNSRKRRVRIGSARGLKPAPVDSPRCGQSAGRQDVRIVPVQIVPDTFCL